MKTLNIMWNQSYYQEELNGRTNTDLRINYQRTTRIQRIMWNIHSGRQKTCNLMV